MTTDVRLVSVDAIVSPDGCSNGIYKLRDGPADVPPLVGPSGNLQRRYSTQVQDAPVRSRVSSGDSNHSFGARSSPLTNIMFLEDFIKEQLGSGYFATVYKVQHRETGQVMAAKINTRQNNWENVQHEIQFLSRISHPNIIRFMGLCIHEGNLHLLLEYINGGTLTDLLCDNDIYLSWSVRIGLASDIAAAMAYLHKKAIMHRDLTSSNVLIKRTGLDNRAVICDLGLSCRFPREHSGLKSPVGTPFWMAPECLNYKPYDEKADVFSFGIVLCEIIVRATADPDELPRLKDFGLDEVSFATIAGNCPEPLMELAFLCCKMNPRSRPAFVDAEFQLQHIKIKLGRQGRAMSDKGTTSSRSRRHTVYLNVLDAANSPTSSQVRRQPLMRSNSDRGARDRRTSRHLNQTNPFDTPALRGGRTKFVNSGRDHLKQLSPDMSIDIGQVLSTLFGRMDVLSIFEKPVKRRLSVSLPSSPELHRREISMEEEDFFDELISWVSTPDNEESDGRTSPFNSNEASPTQCVGESSDSSQCAARGDSICVGSEDSSGTRGTPIAAVDCNRN